MFCLDAKRSYISTDKNEEEKDLDYIDNDDTGLLRHF